MTDAPTRHLRRHCRTVLLLAALCAAGSAPAATTLLTFDTNTTTNEQTLAAYGLQVQGGVGFASAGQLNLLLVTNRVTADFGTFAGDVRLSVDVGFDGLPGSNGAGFRIGDNYLLFHAGYLGGAFRIDGPGGLLFNMDMGFTPTQAALNHMTIDFAAATATAAIRITDGLNPALVFDYVFHDPNYVVGVSVFGLEANGSFTSRFDNLLVQTPSLVPEPSPALLALAGGAALWLRRRQRSGARPHTH